MQAKCYSLNLECSVQVLGLGVHLCGAGLNAVEPLGSQSGFQKWGSRAGLLKFYQPQTLSYPAS